MGGWYSSSQVVHQNIFQTEGYKSAAKDKHIVVFYYYRRFLETEIWDMHVKFYYKK